MRDYFSAVPFVRDSELASFQDLYDAFRDGGCCAMCSTWMSIVVTDKEHGRLPSIAPSPCRKAADCKAKGRAVVLARKAN